MADAQAEFFRQGLKLYPEAVIAAREFLAQANDRLAAGLEREWRAWKPDLATLVRKPMDAEELRIQVEGAASAGPRPAIEVAIAWNPDLFRAAVVLRLCAWLVGDSGFVPLSLSAGVQAPVELVKPRRGQYEFLVVPFDPESMEFDETLERLLAAWDAAVDGALRRSRGDV